jgi:preprotein translocase subunit SecE
VAQVQDNAPNKPVHLIYLFGGVLLFFVLKWTTEWVWGYFTRAPNELLVSALAAVATIIAGVVLYRRDKTYTLITEIAAELKKVTWPTGPEVKAATIVVVVMTVISAVILGFFDIVWSKLTEVIYG